MKQTFDQQIWGLADSPFREGPHRSLFFEGVSVRESLARLRYARSNGRLGLITGPTGSGKSLLLRVFDQQCQNEGNRVARIGLQGISTRELCWELASQLGSSSCLSDDLPRLFQRVTDAITENSLQGFTIVFLLDDVDQAGPDVTSQLVRLVKLKNAQALPLAIVFTSAAEGISRLPAALSELIDLRIELEAWDELDTVGYLQLALVEAGCQQPIFDDASLAEIHRLTGGIPRSVKRLADAALLLGSATAPEIIDTETVKAAHQRLSLPLAATKQ